MKTRSHRKEIGIVSLGCSKNLVDSERLMRQLQGDDIRLHFDPQGVKHLDTVIINTCGFIADAKQESIDTILQYADAKKNGKVGNLFVMGCLSERYKEQLTAEIPEVNGFYGVHELASVIRATGAKYRKELLGDRVITTPSHYAYLKIAEGCDRRCSFCAIPMIRGPHRSMKREEIIKEAMGLADAGVKELLVISQDTTWYGLDIYGKRAVAGLLEELSAIRGIEWIRLHYAYPNGFPLHLLDTIRENNKICRYIDIPLQHISDRILRSMKRGMNGAKTRRLIETIRDRIPGVAIRSTFIVGYPGETDDEFEELMQFIRDVRFERAGVFTFSKEEGTASDRLRDNIPHKVKEARAAALMSLQEEISLENNRNRVGTKVRVIIDGREGTLYRGRTEHDSPEVDNEVLVDAGGKVLKAGSFRDILITGTDAFDLFGKLT